MTTILHGPELRHLVDAVSLAVDVDTTGAQPAADIIDLGSNLASGVALQCDVTALTGTDVTLTLEHSMDKTNWEPLQALPTQTGVGSEFLIKTGPTARYLRWSWVATALTVGLATLRVQKGI